MQDVSFARLRILSRELLEAVERMNSIVEDEDKLYSELCDRDKERPEYWEMDLLLNMQSDLFVVVDTIREDVEFLEKKQEERNNE